MHTTKKTLVAFATNWGTRFGGINSFNTDLLSAVAASHHNEIMTTCVVLFANSAEIKAAADVGVQLVSLNQPHTVKDFTAQLNLEVTEALRLAGVNVDTTETTWLGHDRITGAIALALSSTHGGQSALVHHMSYVHYEPFAENTATARKKVTEQNQLFAKADIVLAIGPLLRNALSDMLDGNAVPMLVPGLPTIALRPAPHTFQAFLSGRLNDSTRKIKQAYLGVAAFGDAIRQCTENIALPSPLHSSSCPRLTLRGVDFEDLDGSIDPEAERDINCFAERYASCVFALHSLPFTQDRSELFNDLRAASVVMMPSWHEGFGLVAWEAIAAGIPLILSRTSGAYLLLQELNSGLYTSMVQVIDVAASHNEPHFTDGDLKKLAEALIQIAKNPSEARARAVQLREKLLGDYTWQNCANKFIYALGWSSDSSAVSIAPTPLPIKEPSLHYLGPRNATDFEDIKIVFSKTSLIGRKWQKRDIATVQLVSPIVEDILQAIETGINSILLTGLPGSGKTCVMLAVQEALEQCAQTRTDLVPLFIQTREFADLATAQDRETLGLPHQWVEKVARLAADARVVVVMDSLDVLSIAREHTLLTYFLAQVDRLLLVKNVTIITACRDFDRHYDRRIAQRQWDREFKCQPLNWAAEIAPLLDKLKIATERIDTVTRELIQNPRELALFVELAKQQGSFNEVTSQALAQRYLEVIVRGNIALGDNAIQAIENIATEMLKTRSLAVPQERFRAFASQNIERELCSLNVLQKTQDGKLTFGHQTLLDVLVISGAVRHGVTLNEFIQGLPPVPFVRPSIRSFVAQLALGDRNEFRKQLRTVLTGNTAFHIRRLVAETFAEQKPQDDDWPLMQDLRTKHREVFQVIYMQAGQIEWHHFWFRHLIPILRKTRDAEGLLAHVARVSQWKNDDAAGVLAFWAEVLALDVVDNQQIAWQLDVALSDFQVKHSALLAPLLVTLLNLPRRSHSSLGRAIARCVKAGGLDDAALWRYVAGDVSDEDVRAYRFDQKLHCQAHEFGNGNDKFLAHRMQQSTALLDLAIASIERWSQIKASRYDGAVSDYSSQFLDETSYNDAHSQTDTRHLESERILLDAIEAAIVHHAKTCSDWWQSNRERLCFSAEGALRYFAILACTATPTSNLDLIGRILCDKSFLESDLSYELGSLMQTTFVQLEPGSQDAVQTTILTIHQETTPDPWHHAWMMQKRAQLIVTIPCYLRSPAAEAVISAREKAVWPPVRQPDIGMRGGIVSAPFPFEVLLRMSDDGVLRLLSHYDGHLSNSFDEFLIGGKEQVGQQLSEAASRQPTRFLNLLRAHWVSIPDRFRDDIVAGAANYLSYKHGNTQPSGVWASIEMPDAQILTRTLLDELDRHPLHWHHNRAASNALQGCSHVIADAETATRLAFLAIGFINLPERDFIQGENVDLLNKGINMIRGHVAEALMITANNLSKSATPFPALLTSTLRRFAANSHPAIRVLILRRLAYCQRSDYELRWELFHLAMQDPTGLWKHAEPWLYHVYQDNFDVVRPVLARIRLEGSDKAGETWGRIYALASLTARTDFTAFLEELKTLDSTEAWSGAASVWSHSENIQKHHMQCTSGLEAGLNARMAHANAVAGRFKNLFRSDNYLVTLPSALVQRYFAVIERGDGYKSHDLFGIDEWLNATAQRDPEQALETVELYLAYIKHTKSYLYDHDDNLTQLMTRLFVNAEENEEIDNGVMLHRVVALQDTLLGLGVEGMNKWLKAAERP